MIHDMAVIDKGARIGKGTKIWHFCHVMGGAEIGKNCILGQNVFVGNNVRIGDGCKIQNNVSLYDGVILGDNVFIGPAVTFTNVKYPRADIEQKDNFLKTYVNDGATIGANSTIICGITIGEGGFVGAGSVVTKDVPINGIAFGNPARNKKLIDLG